MYVCCTLPRARSWSGMANARCAWPRRDEIGWMVSGGGGGGSSTAGSGSGGGSKTVRSTLSIACLAAFSAIFFSGPAGCFSA